MKREKGYRAKGEGLFHDQRFRGRAKELNVTAAAFRSLFVASARGEPTGSKSVLTYLVKPVLKLKNEAFRER